VIRASEFGKKRIIDYADLGEVASENILVSSDRLIFGLPACAL
jgi:hypothetical protein